jgi:hypothetical protein
MCNVAKSKQGHGEFQRIHGRHHLGQLEHNSNCIW